MKFFLYISLVLVFFACNSKEENNKVKSSASIFKKEEFKDVFFDIEEHGNYTRVEVVNPLNIDEKEIYILYDSTFVPHDSIEATHFIQVPAKSIACLSTSHLGYLVAMGKENSVRAALNPELIYSKQLQQNYHSGSLVSLGGAKLDMESLVSLNIEVVFASVFDAAGMKNIDQMRNLGIKVVMVSEYLEEKPLEKVKWIDFFASFYNEQAQQTADSVYKKISTSYKEAKALVANKERSKVITGLPWKGNWYVPSGNSFQTNFLKDAGAQYIFEDDNNLNSKTVDFEVMLNKGMNMPYWIHVSDLEAINELQDLDERYTAFRAYKEQNIYNNNARKNKAGGNDYWESGAVNADVVLKDLIKIFHPDLLPEHSFYYYKKLEKQ